jgi:hypothetical protein
MEAAKKAGFVLAVVGLLAVGASPAMAGGAQGSGVVVHRGADIALETASSGAAATVEHGVAVHRGKVPERTLMAPDRDEARRYAVTAGEDLWFVERGSGRVVVCELRKTSTVGKSVVDCFRGKPAALRN